MEGAGKSIPSSGESDFHAWFYHSSPETSTVPTQQRPLGADRIMRHYQIGPNDRARAERVEILRESIAAYEEAKRARPRNPQPMYSRTIAGTVHGHIKSSSHKENAAYGTDQEQSDFPDDWVLWLGRCVPELIQFLAIFRLVAISAPPFPHHDVPMRILILLDREIVTPDHGQIGGTNACLRPFEERRGILRRERRLGLCQRREMIIRRMGRPFVGFSFDF